MAARGPGWIFSRPAGAVSDEENAKAVAAEQLAVTGIAVFGALLLLRIVGSYLSRR